MFAARSGYRPVSPWLRAVASHQVPSSHKEFLAPMLSLSNLVKRYGGVLALDGAHLEAQWGEVHGLLGPNGSGKSTINKILAGSVRPDSATIAIDGAEVAISSPADAARYGIGAVYQQLSLVETLTVGENLVLGTEPTRFGFRDTSAARTAASAMLERLRPGLGDVSLNTVVADLDPGQQQLIEIGKVLARSPRILVLDEATASLRRGQVELLFDLVRELRDEGVIVLFVSHRLDEVLQICDRATIVRTGRTVATVDISQTTTDELVRLMVGDVLLREKPTESLASDEVLLEVRDLAGPRLDGVSFRLHRGEVLGLGGLQGQGQSELLMALFGALPHTGTVTLAGKDVSRLKAHTAARNGVALVPGNRGTQGMFAQRPIQENLSIVSLWRRLTAGIALTMKRERKVGDSAVEQLAIKIGSLDDPVSSLSGGNAQKVIIAKWLAADPEVVLLDDPTKGVDVGAKAEIYHIARALAEQGKAIIINSSEDRELVTLCDRVLVLFEGKVIRELVGTEITEENLVAAALKVGEEVA